GIDHFVRFVFPLIRLIVPNAELHLVGGCNDQVWVEKLQMTNGVLYRGFVDDLLMEYAAARVTVAPIYSGTGTNIKVLESMQARRPCITTICGFRGFDGCFSNNRELVVVDDDEEFSEQVVSLLTNIDRNHRMAEMAYQCVVTHFTREAFNSIVQLHLKKQ
ncbi:MAG: glycosyltransferase family 4 protein, partial [Alphaproteobacteria bacterium]|nr:glycosyltransferase family 4 protein [Alphaproteobacteria bacterium]